MTFLDLGRYGRLGNQMWQIASTIGVASRNNDYALFPKWPYSMTLPWASREDLSAHKWRRYDEQGTGYQEMVLDNAYNWSLCGYFQSWKYFDHIRHDIPKFFGFCEGHPPLNFTSVHVRRGDYLDRDLHPVLERDYYEKAFSIIPGPYLFFSDDIEWVKRNFTRPDAVYCEEEDPATAMSIMSRCRDNIIANSSFSWWAAYLNRNPHKRIVAPSNWVKGETTDDRIPPGWIKL